MRRVDRIIVGDELLNLASAIKNELRTLDLDVRKNVKGNRAAGVRLRHSIRSARENITELIRISVQYENARQDAKKDD